MTRTTKADALVALNVGLDLEHSEQCESWNEGGTCDCGIAAFKTARATLRAYLEQEEPAGEPDAWIVETANGYQSMPLADEAEARETLMYWSRDPDMSQPCQLVPLYRAAPPSSPKGMNLPVGLAVISANGSIVDFRYPGPYSAPEGSGFTTRGLYFSAPVPEPPSSPTAEPYWMIESPRRMFDTEETLPAMWWFGPSGGDWSTVATEGRHFVSPDAARQVMKESGLAWDAAVIVTEHLDFSRAAPVAVADWRAPFDKRVDPLTEAEIWEAFAYMGQPDEVGRGFEYIQNFGKDPEVVRLVVTERARCGVPATEPDAARLDWLEKTMLAEDVWLHGDFIFNSNDGRADAFDIRTGLVTEFCNARLEVIEKRSLREAIDAARGIAPHPPQEEAR